MGSLLVVVHDVKDFDSQKVMDAIGDDGREELIRMFLEQEPLRRLRLAAEMEYDRPGVKRSAVMKQLGNHPHFKLYSIFKLLGATSGPHPRKFKESVERHLRQRGKRKC